MNVRITQGLTDHSLINFFLRDHLMLNHTY